MRRSTTLVFVTALLGLGACDQLGIESAAVQSARREADGKAIGAGCRQAARSVELCFELNKRADRAAVFAGWREMNDYMRENQLEAMPAQAPLVAADAGEAVNEAPPADKLDRPAKKPH